MDFSSSAAFARTVEIANTKIVRVAASATKVLDALESLDRDDSRGRFTGRLDLNRMATIGHSERSPCRSPGSILESRLRSILTGGFSTPRAADGVLQVQHGSIARIGIRRMRIWRRSYAVFGPPEGLVCSQRITAGFAKLGGVEAIGNARHEDFSDSPYLSRRAAFLGRRPDGHAIRAVGDCAVILLESVFRGDASASCKTSTPNAPSRCRAPPLRPRRSVAAGHAGASRLNPEPGLRGLGLTFGGGALSHSNFLEHLGTQNRKPLRSGG
jgi:hypothetical protein